MQVYTRPNGIRQVAFLFCLAGLFQVQHACGRSERRYRVPCTDGSYVTSLWNKCPNGCIAMMPRRCDITNETALPPYIRKDVTFKKFNGTVCILPWVPCSIFTLPETYNRQNEVRDKNLWICEDGPSINEAYFTFKTKCPNGCGIFEKKCTQGRQKNECVFRYASCDFSECMEGEKLCRGGTTCVPKNTTCLPYCPYPCSNETCVESSSAKCPNGCYSNQKKCPDGSCRSRLDKCICPDDNYYTCDNSTRCYNDTQMCNGIRDCHDGSDESTGYCLISSVVKIFDLAIDFFKFIGAIVTPIFTPSKNEGKSPTHSGRDYITTVNRTVGLIVVGIIWFLLLVFILCRDKAKRRTGKPGRFTLNKPHRRDRANKRTGKPANITEQAAIDILDTDSAYSSVHLEVDAWLPDQEELHEHKYTPVHSQVDQGDDIPTYESMAKVTHAVPVDTPTGAAMRESNSAVPTVASPTTDDTENSFRFWQRSLDVIWL